MARPPQGSLEKPKKQAELPRAQAGLSLPASDKGHKTRAPREHKRQGVSPGWGVRSPGAWAWHCQDCFMTLSKALPLAGPVSSSVSEGPEARSPRPIVTLAFYDITYHSHPQRASHSPQHRPFTGPETGPHLSQRLLLAQSCPTLSNPMDCSPPGSSVHRILQARILEWVAMPSCRGSSQLRD